MDARNVEESKMTLAETEGHVRARLKSARKETAQIESRIAKVDRYKGQTLHNAQASGQVYTNLMDVASLPHDERQEYGTRSADLRELFQHVEDPGASNFFQSLDSAIQTQLITDALQAQQRQQSLRQEIVYLKEQNRPYLEKELREVASSLATQLDMQKILADLSPEKMERVLEQYFLARALIVTDRLTQDKSRWDYQEMGDLHQLLMKAGVEWADLKLFRQHPENPLSEQDVQDVSNRVQQGEYNLVDGDEEFPLDRLIPSPDDSLKPLGKGTRKELVTAVFTWNKGEQFLRKLERTESLNLEDLKSDDEVPDLLTLQAAAFLNAEGNFRRTIYKNKTLFPQDRFQQDPTKKKRTPPVEFFLLPRAGSDALIVQAEQHFGEWFRVTNKKRQTRAGARVLVRISRKKTQSERIFSES